MFGGDLLPAVVSAGADRRTVRPGGRTPTACANCRSPRRAGRSSIAKASRSPPAWSPTRCRSCPRRCRPPGHPRLELYRRLGALLGDERRHIEALVIKGRTALPYAPVTIKTAAGPGRADRARRAPERIPRRHPAARLDPLLSVRGDGRAGARLRRPGLRTRAEEARLQGRQAGHGRRPGRARVLLRPLSARARRACSACRSTPQAIPSPRACSRRCRRPATA